MITEGWSCLSTVIVHSMSTLGDTVVHYLLFVYRSRTLGDGAVYFLLRFVVRDVREIAITVVSL